MNQSETSVTHRNHIAAGLTVTSEQHHGSGDDAVSLIRYSDGSTWYYDNGSAMRLDVVFGWPSANTSNEPAWFLTSDDAARFARDCGWEPVDDYESISADSVALSDVLIR